MYEFYLGDNKHTIKNAWEELSPEQFIDIAELLSHFRKGEVSLFEMRVLVTCVLIGINPRRLKIKGHEDQFNENIYRLSREIHFFFRYEYDPKSFSAFSPEMRKLLIHTSPDDLPETPESRAAIKLKRNVKIEAEFGKNLIPHIRLGRQKYTGYTFDIVDGIAQTTLSALQYSEAQKVIGQYYEKESAELLNLLCGILYQTIYRENIAIDLARQFKGVEHKIKEAVLLNFLAITNFIVHRTKYSILFDRPKKAKKEQKYSLGLADNMYMLSKKGYGDSRQMEDAGLFKFFDLLIKELGDQARELEGLKKKKTEIAEIMNLSIEQVNDLL